jgi:hypothetical protein
MDRQYGISFDPFAERDRAAKKLKQAYNRAKLARNKVEMTRIEQQLKFWGVSV